MLNKLTASAIAAATTALPEVLTDPAHFDFQRVGGIGGLVLGVTWFLSQRFQKIEDRLNRIEQIVDPRLPAPPPRPPATPAA